MEIKRRFRRTKFGSLTVLAVALPNKGEFMFSKVGRRASVLALGVVAALAAVSAGGTASDPFDLVPGTAVLADNFSSGGDRGNTSSTTSSTNIFSPSVFVDYK